MRPRVFQPQPLQQRGQPVWAFRQLLAGNVDGIHKPHQLAVFYRVDTRQFRIQHPRIKRRVVGDQHGAVDEGGKRSVHLPERGRVLKHLLRHPVQVTVTHRCVPRVDKAFPPPYLVEPGIEGHRCQFDDAVAFPRVKASGLGVDDSKPGAARL